MSASRELCLTTARLSLRPLRESDAETIAAYRSLPVVARYQSWEAFGWDDARRLIESQQASEPGVAGTWFQLAIVEAATQRVIGDCGLHCLAAEPRHVELGITLSPVGQGSGYATEALRSVLDFVFGQLAMHRVSAVVDAKNDRAAALFRRLGFRHEAHFVEHVWYKGEWGSEEVFALLRREWEARS